MEESKLGIFNAENQLTEEISLDSDSSKNRLKLILLFSKLMQVLMQLVATNHNGRWDNQFSQFVYHVTMNATKR